MKRIYSLWFVFLQAFVAILAWLGFLVLFLQKQNHKSQDITFIIDVSHSMNVRDIAKEGKTISRLDKAKEYITSNINNLSGHRLWVIVYAQNSIYYTPPTYDYENFSKTINMISTNITPFQWGNLLSWLQLLTQTTPDSVWVVLSDFELDSYSMENLPRGNFLFIWLWSEHWSMPTYPDGAPLPNATISRLDIQKMNKLSSQLYASTKENPDNDEFLDSVQSSAGKQSNSALQRAISIFSVLWL